MQLDPQLLEILACPQCHAPLRVDDAAQELVCTSDTCGLAYPVRDEIPVLLIDEARRPDDAPRRDGPTGSDGADHTDGADRTDSPDRTDGAG